MASDPDRTEPPQTRMLLLRWHQGERAALDQLLDRDLAWIRARVEARMGPRLGARAEAEDYVQEAMLRVLSYGPRFVMSDKADFRALMARIIENTLRHQAESLSRARRDAARESPLARDSVLHLDPPEREVTRPSAAAERNIQREWIRLAIDLLPAEDCRIVRQRDWEQASFAELGAELGLSEDAARMRYNRILPRLARQVERLQRGELRAALRDSGC